jgi:hypothetical protein
LPIFHYDAARAALAGWGKSLADLNDVERSHHRRQALGWLSADLATWAKLIDIQAERPKARQTMQHWLVDPDLAGVRGDAIAKLPEAERADWQKLWAEVAARLTALGDVGPKQPPAAKP